MRPRADELTGTQKHALPAPPHPQLVAMWPGGMMAKELPETGRLTVGRSAGCDITIDHSSVSRVHAIVHGGFQVEVEDLGSTNGTTVAGQRIAERTRVAVERGRVMGMGAAVLVVHGALDAIPHGPARSARPSGGAAAPAVVIADDAMRELYRIVDLVAKGDLSVVLLGETGTGKDVFAHAIHQRSRRATSAYVCLNCGAVPDALLESELFGHERGAFTGALQAKTGLFESADGGTLFLDEIADLPLPMQVKLLRVLENREITRVGGLRPRRIDVRIICATNGDLAGRVAAGAFRQDLYFRLNGIALTIPPLRERQSEIGPLAREFVRDACRRAGGPERVLTDGALVLLEGHSWPGNVRELKNAIERAVTLCSGTSIDVQHLALAGAAAVPADRTCPTEPPTSTGANPVPSLGMHEDARRAARLLERRRIAEAMERCGGNQTRAAKLLRVSRRTLVARLTEYGFARPLKDRGSEPE
ncbi:MAG: sigma 54-dependent Fis family transcriptional regulator [Myxococcota bacterium]|nr:sigma 54-dependent Fis family transcriptional regulator [Myxococcota bacterium]